MDYKFLSTIDNSGRFVIPKKILKNLNWGNLGKVLVTVEDDKVIITNADEFVTVCGNCNKELRKDFIYCPYCGKKINEER